MSMCTLAPAILWLIPFLIFIGLVYFPIITPLFTLLLFLPGLNWVEIHCRHLYCINVQLSFLYFLHFVPCFHRIHSSVRKLCIKWITVNVEILKDLVLSFFTNSANDHVFKYQLYANIFLEMLDLYIHWLTWCLHSDV